MENVPRYTIPGTIGWLIVIVFLAGCLGGGGVDPGGADAILGLEDEEEPDRSRYTCEQLKELNDSVRCDGDERSVPVDDDTPPIWIVQENDQTVTQEQMQDQAQTQDQTQRALVDADADAGSTAEADSDSASSADSRGQAMSASGSGSVADAGGLAVVDVNIASEPEDEYIVFENTREDPIAMGGWTVRDRADEGRVDGQNLRPFVFPANFVLQPGARVTLWTGEGENSRTELHWETGNQIWNREGDVVRIFDSQGNLVFEHTIEGQTKIDPDGPDSDPGDGGNGEGGSQGDDGPDQTGDGRGQASIEFLDCDVVEITGGFERAEIDVTFYASDGADSDTYDLGPVEDGRIRIDSSMFDYAINGYVITGVTLEFVDSSQPLYEQNPDECAEEIKPARPSISFVDAEAIDDGAIEATFSYENPNDVALDLNLEITDGTTDDRFPLDSLEPGEHEFTVIWMPDSTDETLTVSSDLTGFGHDETIGDSTDAAGSYLDGESVGEDQDTGEVDESEDEDDSDRSDIEDEPEESSGDNDGNEGADGDGGDEGDEDGDDDDEGGNGDGTEDADDGASESTGASDDGEDDDDGPDDDNDGNGRGSDGGGAQSAEGDASDDEGPEENGDGDSEDGTDDGEIGNDDGGDDESEDDDDDDGNDGDED